MTNSLEVLILAGGKGTRLASVINDVPKPMAPIKGIPFLEFLLKSVQLQGFQHICLLVGYKSEIIQEYFGDGSKWGLSIRYSHETFPLGTGGCIRQAIQSSSYDKFLILNGDTLFEGDLKYFVSLYENAPCMALKYVQRTDRYGQVSIDEKFQVESFSEKGKSTGDGYINAGIYLFSRQILDYFPDKFSFSIEQDVFPLLTAKKYLMAFPLGGKFIDIGIPEDYERAQYFLESFEFKFRSPTLFLDRDGVIIKDTGYVSECSEVEIYPEIIPIIKFANSKKIPVIMVTNQAGIGRGYFTLEKCHEINSFIIDTLKDSGATIDDWYLCPYHQTAGIGEYLRKSLLRKPDPGMILLASEKFSIDIKKSLVIGDKVSDIISLPGLNTILLQRNYGLEDASGLVPVFTDLNVARNYVVSFFGQD